MITLKLNKEQATILSLILDRVGGSPSDSGRKHVDEIRLLMREQGYDHNYEDEQKYPLYVMSNGLYFGDAK